MLSKWFDVCEDLCGGITGFGAWIDATIILIAVLGLLAAWCFFMAACVRK